MISFWASNRWLFDTESFFYFLFFFFEDFWLSVFYCFPRSIITVDSSSVLNFFCHITTLLSVYTHTTTEIYDSSSCLLTWHKLCFISYLLLFTAVQMNRTQYFGVQQNNSFKDHGLHFTCISYNLILHLYGYNDIIMNVFFKFTLNTAL